MTSEPHKHPPRYFCLDRNGCLWCQAEYAEARVAELEARVKDLEAGRDLDDRDYQAVTAKADEWMRIATANAETTEELRAKVDRYEKGLDEVLSWVVNKEVTGPTSVAMHQAARRALTEAEEWAVGTEWQRFMPEAEGEK